MGCCSFMSRSTEGIFDMIFQDFDCEIEPELLGECLVSNVESEEGLVG